MSVILLPSKISFFTCTTLSTSFGSEISKELIPPWFNLTEENRVTERTVLNHYSVSELSQARQKEVANLRMHKEFSVFYWVLMRLFHFN